MKGSLLNRKMSVHQNEILFQNVSGIQNTSKKLYGKARLLGIYSEIQDNNER